jgi:hypothetical protein
MNMMETWEKVDVLVAESGKVRRWEGRKVDRYMETIKVNHDALTLIKMERKMQREI